MNVLSRRSSLSSVSYFLMHLQGWNLYWAALQNFSICFLTRSFLSIVLHKSITSLLYLTVIGFVTIRCLLRFFWFSIINWKFPALAFDEFALNQSKIFFITHLRLFIIRIVISKSACFWFFNNKEYIVSEYIK